MMILFLPLLLLAGAVSPEAATPSMVHVLASSAETPATPYLAFPAVLDLGSELLVSFKRGGSHAGDAGAELDVLRVDRATGRVLSRKSTARLEGKIMQMGEWVRFANGDIASCIDAQQKEAPTRIGLRVVRSSDGGRTFSRLERLGAIDGVEYGYAFDAITEGQRTWMLVMTFANLEGGKQVWNTRSQPGSVDIIRTDDNGRSWHFVRSLTQELGGAPINESCFARHEDGFIIAARGYDQHQWLARLDADFRVLQKVDLASSHAFIKSHLGRPRLYTRDGGWYLLARHFTGTGANRMRLGLFRFDPATLAIKRHVILDNATEEPVSDGYYAQAYWQEGAGGDRFNVITYKRLGEGKPDILRLEYAWKDVK